MAETVDYAPFETTTAGPAEQLRAPRRSRPRSSSRLHDVPVELAVEVGRTQMTIREALALGPGSIVTLNRLAGEPVDLLVNGKPIARGEVVVIDEEFGLRVTEVLGARRAPSDGAPEAAQRRLDRRAYAVYGRCASRRPSRRPPSGARPTRTASPASRRWWPTTCCCRSSRWR